MKLGLMAAGFGPKIQIEVERIRHYEVLGAAIRCIAAIRRFEFAPQVATAM